MHDAYLAGLIDGEGSIMLLGQGPRRSRRVNIAVSITEPHVLEAIRADYGGFLHRPKDSVPSWRMSGLAALEVLRRIRPYLVIQRRRALADLLLDDPIIPRLDITKAGKIAHNEALFQEMRERNSHRLAGLPTIPAQQPRDADFEYLAGILDGEGWVSDLRVRRVEVHSTDPELPAWLQSRFAGKTYADYRKQRPSTHRPTWSWRRSVAGASWGPRVADSMLLDRKADRLRAAATSAPQRRPTPKYKLPHASDAAYLALRDQGILMTAAARESGLPLRRARFLRDA